MTNTEMQTIAKQTIKYIKSNISVGQSLAEIRKLCEDRMLELGADSFWYYNIGAFVFSGNETTVSISGRKYNTPNKVIENNDIITIDLSPQYRHIWGDYARTIVVENGAVVDKICKIQNNEWRTGLLFENRLHEELIDFVTSKTTFEELYFYMNDYITENGYVNLDFNNNLGHSIAKYKIQRIYIEKGNKKKLSSVDYFTFEPHIGKVNSYYGFKKENIYKFVGTKLVSL